jgi:hypothetical protein
MAGISNKTLKTLATGLAVAIVAPLIVEYIRKQIKKKEAAKQPSIEANTDHSFSSWVGDDNFFEIEGDTNVRTNPFMSLVPLTSKERMKKYPQFVKYKPFSVTPSKKIKIV